MEWIQGNMEWIFSGIGIFVLGGIISVFRKNRSHKNIKMTQKGTAGKNIQMYNEQKAGTKAGESPANFQIAGDINFGIKIEEARQIALDVFQANFYKLSEEAALKATGRAEELVNEFLKMLFEQKENMLEKLKDPAVQYTLFNIQREYAKSGDSELKEQLLKLSIERICSEERSLKQIVLDEALETLPKLSREHLDLITLVFIVQNLTVKLFQKEHIENIPFDANEVIEHLKMFCIFSPKDLRQHIVGHLQYLGCIREVINNGNMFDSPVSTINALIKRYCGHDVPQEEMTSTIASIHRNFALYYRRWKMKENSIIKLTTVGLTIGIVNYNKRTGAQVKLDDFL